MMVHLQPCLAFLLVICATALFVSAVPSSTNHEYNLADSVPPPSPPIHQYHDQKPLRVWPKLRDAVVEAVWGTRESQQQTFSSEKPPSSLSAAPSALQARYGEDVVLRFFVENPSQVAALREASNILFLDVWSSTDEWVDIRLAKDVIPSLLGLLPSSLQNAHAPLIRDLAQTVYESYPSASSQLRGNRRPFSPFTRQPSSDATDLFFQDYQPLSTIVPWMRLMASMFSTHVQMISVGTSFEGRDIPALRVGANLGGPGQGQQQQRQPGPRKTIVIAGGAHAREWISVSSVNYLAYTIITENYRSSAVSLLLTEFDWVLIPTLNPDGYVYTWESDRLWRKNRQETDFPFCRGLDLDRSWGFEWQGEETSSNPCSESYAGDGPFEAVEANQFAMWAKNETENNDVEFVGYLDLHSYSQQILYPYSFSCGLIPPNLENLEELAEGMVKAIRWADREFYDVSPACEGMITSDKSKKTNTKPKETTRIESTGGSALDWFYHELHVRYAFQIKLRDRGSYGFMLPPDNIVPTGNEVFNAAMALGQFMLGPGAAEIDWDAEFQHPDENRHPLTAELGIGRTTSDEIKDVAVDLPDDESDDDETD